MSAERFKDIQRIFQEAQGLDPAERGSYIDRACGDDEAMRDEVSSLLSLHDEGTVSFLGQPALEGGIDASAASALTKPTLPDRIGPYRILQLLGEGGFAVVYLAEQTTPVRRQVAVKVMKAGLDTAQVIARFEAERQALAIMDHANVAKVFDAGTTDKDRPYFVIEYVPGVPITDYCDRHCLSNRERIELFTQVCEAVQHAHQKGIIHRDIKPSNVLVAVKQSGPLVKVIDFGVAKARNQPLTERTLFTEHGQLIGTPEYMSPEQADMSALDIDTRSDIYSLGVLLYELLVGSLPFDSRTLREAGFGEIQRIIREVEPPKPSTRVSEGTKRRSDDAAKGRAGVALERELRGDLDWITMKALEKDRTRRYESATALAEDLRRHLSHEPVVAGPPTATYRVRKFVRRNRGLVAAAGVVIAVLVVGIAGTSTGLAMAVAARKDEETQRKIAEQRTIEAETQAAITRAVNEFLNEDLLAAASPEQNADRDVTVREVLDKAAGSIEGRFDDEPLVEASIRITLGRTYLQLGEYEPAEPHLVKALDLRRGALDDEDQRTFATMSALADLYADQGRFEEAESLYRDALAGARVTLGEEHKGTLGLMNNLGTVYDELGRAEEAGPLYETVLEHRRRTLGDDDEATIVSMINMALFRRRTGDPEDAETLFVTALDSAKRVLGEKHPHTLVTMVYLGSLYWSQKRFDEAEPLYIDGVRLHREVMGEDHPRTLLAKNNLATLYTQTNEHEKAEPLYEEVLEGRRRALGEEHTATLLSMYNLAGAYITGGSYDRAETVCVESSALARSILPEDDWRIGLHVTRLGIAIGKQGRAAEAEPVLLEGHALIAGGVSDSHGASQWSVRSIAEFYEANDRDQDAEAWRGRMARK